MQSSDPPPRPQSPALALEVIGISKRFGSLLALDQVSLQIHAGSVHALLGGNGAGKSTLVKCVMGYHPPDQGQILVFGREREIDGTQAAHALGLGMVYQHFTLVAQMTVLENLVLASHPIPLVIDWERERARLTALMAATPFRISLDSPVTALAAGEKQKVEILKQLFLRRRILILDEPTSVLTPDEADEMLSLVRSLTRTEGLTVIIITHKFREVMNYADAVTVLRRGRLAGSGPLQDYSPAKLSALMLGNDVIPEPAKRDPVEPGPVRLCLTDLKVANDAGVVKVNALNLDVRAGEIVGIAGVAGNGQRELVEALAGQRDVLAGAMTVCAEVYRATRAEMRRQSVHCLPEEPLRNACVADMDLTENLALRDFDCPPYSWHGWLLRPRNLLARALESIARFDVQPPTPRRPVATLSGGNLQRLVLARELSGKVAVLITANPCFGLDFAATADVRRRLLEARNRGAAVLLLSEDLDEIFEMSDRIVVLCDGRISYAAATAGADRGAIGRHMAGHSA